jgi:predicted aconitase with swiveling domain
MNGRIIFDGKAEGEALVTDIGISFYGGVDPESGVVLEKDHPLEGQSISGKVLVFPRGKGSTVGSYTLYRLMKGGAAPLAIINVECDTVVAVGAIISEIPCVDQIPAGSIANGQTVTVNGDEVTVA